MAKYKYVYKEWVNGRWRYYYYKPDGQPPRQKPESEKLKPTHTTSYDLTKIGSNTLRYFDLDGNLLATHTTKGSLDLLVDLGKRWTQQGYSKALFGQKITTYTTADGTETKTTRTPGQIDRLADIGRAWLKKVKVANKK